MITEKDFITGLLAPYGIYPRALTPFHGNTKKLATTIKAGLVFFGDLSVNPTLLKIKAPGTVLAGGPSGSEWTGYDTAITRFQNATMFAIQSKDASSTAETRNYTIQNMLFDDIGWTKSASTATPGYVGDFDMNTTAMPFLSLSRAVKNGNVVGGNPSGLYAPGMLTTNAQYDYAPQFYLFTGYLINTGG